MINKENVYAMAKTREILIINEMLKLRNKQKILKNINLKSNNNESYIKNLEEESDMCVDKIIKEIFNMK